MDDSRNIQPEIAHLAPAQQEAVLESLDAGLRLSPEETERRNLARSLAPADVWGATAGSCVVHIVESYRRGDVDMQDALAGLQRISVGANSQYRILLLGLTAARLLQEEPDPRKSGQRRPDWPLWLRTATADLILVYQQHSPEQRRSPSPHYGDPSSPLIETALDILTKVGWFEPDNIPAPRTVDGWVRARRQDKPADQ